MAGAGAIGIAGAALSGLSLVSQGMGQKRAYEFEAEKAQIAARVGRIQADQIDTAHRNELTGVLSSIRAIRAAAGTSADSPTGLAVAERERQVSGQTRRIEVSNKLMQARVSEMDAKFLRQSARTALFGGILGGLAAGVRGIGAARSG